MRRVKQNLTVGRAANQRRRLSVEPSRRYLALNNLLPQRQTERGLHFRMIKDCCPSTRPTLFDPGLSLTPVYAVFVRRFSRSSCFLSFSAAANTVLQSARVSLQQADRPSTTRGFKSGASACSSQQPAASSSKEVSRFRVQVPLSRWRARGRGLRRMQLLRKFA